MCKKKRHNCVRNECVVDLNATYVSVHVAFGNHECMNYIAIT